MASITEYRCEICGRVSADPIRWFVIQCDSDHLNVMKWNSSVANEKGARHFCGEAHAQVYISRWLESACSPAKPDFMQKPSTR